MKFLLSAVLLFSSLGSVCYAETSEECLVPGAAYWRLDHQKNQFSKSDVFVCGPGEGTKYRCEFENEVRYIVDGKPFTLEPYAGIGDGMCYYLRKN